ncbi:CRISPR-associated protein (Cas_Cas02710) [Nitrosomonas marina]|uniref:CRISPR-associated protein (Cas_Cas02710) n=1 Tax=Nitrosomonas marina TaxID=917 RepID=A0A1I0FXM3_9PROT|nr:hypothetical protein [Nitrosomonas marina]SET63166.1 CRISPR-associated protein (Cas_Cas02710) [Nitrosomonas marina]
MNYKNTKKIEFLKISSLTLMAVISAGWIGDAIKGECLFTHFWELFWGISGCGLLEYCISLILVTLSFIYSAKVLYEKSQNLFYKNLQHTDKPTAHRVLIMAVSKLFPPPVAESDGIYIYLSKNQRVKLTGEIKTDIEEFNNQEFNVNTQQFLRAIEPHIDDSLEKVFLIGSKDFIKEKSDIDEGSFNLLDTVSKILRLYKEDLEISIHGEETKGVPFEDVDLLRRAYEKMIQQALETEGKDYTEHDIIIDVTGGKKTVSIAAAMATFGHKNLKFQYVETGGDNPILTFNIEAGSIPKIV